MKKALIFTIFAMFAGTASAGTGSEQGSFMVLDSCQVHLVIHADKWWYCMSPDMFSQELRNSEAHWVEKTTCLLANYNELYRSCSDAGEIIVMDSEQRVLESTVDGLVKALATPFSPSVRSGAVHAIANLSGTGKLNSERLINVVNRLDNYLTNFDVPLRVTGNDFYGDVLLAEVWLIKNHRNEPDQVAITDMYRQAYSWVNIFKSAAAWQPCADDKNDYLKLKRKKVALANLDKVLEAERLLDTF